MKILVVHYGPGENSKTDQVTEALQLKAQKESLDFEFLDLVENTPHLFNRDSMKAYVRRNYKGETLESDELAHLEEMDQMTQQLLDSDMLVMVFPMYNFGLPAAVKAWIDSVAQAKKTFEYTEYGPKGLLNTKKAIIIPISGGTPQNSSKDFITKYMEVIMGFMGINETTVLSEGFGSRYKSEEELINSIISRLTILQAQ